MLRLLTSIHIAHIACYWQFWLVAVYSYIGTGFSEKIMPVLRVLWYNGSLITWTVVAFTTSKFKPPIFFSATANWLCLKHLCTECLVNNVPLLQCNFCGSVCWSDHVIAAEPLSSNGRCLQIHYLATAVVFCGRCLAMGLHATILSDFLPWNFRLICV
jgi:hypothetical protein